MKRTSRRTWALFFFLGIWLDEFVASGFCSQGLCISFHLLQIQCNNKIVLIAGALTRNSSTFGGGSGHGRHGICHLFVAARCTSDFKTYS